MKTRNIIMGLAFLFIAGSLVLNSCKKDNSSPSSSNGITGQQVAQVQNSDVQDAIADKTEQDIDNTADEIQNSDYQGSSTAKDASTSSRIITIVSGGSDSTTFPKTIQIVYVNWKDSTADENLIKNGEIDITVHASDAKHRLVTRNFSFINFSVTTDSTTVSINGNRTTTRTKDTLAIYPKKKLVRLAVTDSINADLNYSIIKTGSTVLTDSMKFNRVVKKQRVGSAWYEYSVVKLHLIVSHLASRDTLTFTGKVYGNNEKDEPYNKLVTSALHVDAYKGTLIISSGSISYTGGSGSTAFSYTITFEQDPNHLHKTLVTVTNTITGKTHSFDRKLSGKFVKWW